MGRHGRIKNRQVQEKLQKHKITVSVITRERGSKFVVKSKKKKSVEGSGGTVKSYRGPHAQNKRPHAEYQEKQQGQSSEAAVRAWSNDIDLPTSPCNPNVPNIDDLKVLLGIMISDAKGNQVDSAKIIHRRRSEQNLEAGKIQLELKPQTANVLNNLGCACAFLYAKNCQKDLKERAKDSFQRADKAGGDDVAKGVATENLKIVEQW